MMGRFLAFILIITLSSCSQNIYTKLTPVYEKEQLAEIPDYSQLIYWAAHPDKKDPSDSVPKDLIANSHPKQDVDVFFVYPTSYLDPTQPFGWSASLKDAKTNAYTDYTSILNQASIFNEVGRIYAPRYRQAHISSYNPVGHADTVKALAAFELAYQDVKTAFEYYLAHYNNGRPIVIASHSQGSTHSIRLLKEFFDNKPLAKQLVVAYTVGMALDPATFSKLEACATPNSTGCICAWRTYLKGYEPPFVAKEKFTSMVTNPITWSKNQPTAQRNLNEGSVLYDFNKITKHVAGAINHDGVLWTPKPHFLGSFLYTTKNYHIADFNFYYVSVRKNVADRVNTYLENQKTSTH